MEQLFAENCIVKSKRNIWRICGDVMRAYRYRRYAGHVRLVPALGVDGKILTK